MSSLILKLDSLVDLSVFAGYIKMTFESQNVDSICCDNCDNGGYMYNVLIEIILSLIFIGLIKIIFIVKTV